MSDLSMKPSRDELNQRRPSARRGAPAGGPGWSAGIKLLVLGLALGGGGAGYFLWQKIQGLNEALSTSQASLGSLQDKVQSQDQSLSKTGDQVSTSIAKLDLEVRKLWDLTNKRNRPDIDKLQKDVETLAKSLEGVTKSNGELQARLTQAVSDNKALRGEIDKLRETTASVDKLTTQMASLRNETHDLAEAQRSLGAAQDKLAAKGAAPDVSKRVGDIENDIRAINAHRQQINARMAQFDQDLQSLKRR